MFFPFTTRTNWGKLEVEPYFDYSKKGMLLINLVLVFVLLVLKLINQRKIYSVFNVIDFLIVGMLGIFGFIGVLVFPNRK
jgi:hypothetical protein